MWHTEEDRESTRPDETRTGPGLVVVWDGRAPAMRAHALDRAGLVLGRETLAPLADDRISRQHAHVRCADGGIVVRDLGSRNGTYVAGQRITGEVWVQAPVVIRTGRTLCVVVEDLRRFLAAGALAATPDGGIAEPLVGPTLAVAWRGIARAARTGDNLLLTGETGTGKELAARAYHAATGATGALVSVNCAAIPAGLAERLLFGARRGAYSGADRDVDGYLAAADHGTLFLDELGELEPAVQGKLLRVLETREVLPLGAARPRPLVLRVVAATLRDLRAEVAERRFREDLYHRVGRPEVHLPPLRARLEEIPWHITRTVAQAAPGLAIASALVERCLIRPWPGNVRELIGEVRRAALAALETGAAEVGVDDLDPSAGLRLVTGAPIAPAQLPAHLPQTHAQPPLPAAHAPVPAPAAIPDRDTIARALAAEGGNVARAARALGLHRNQLRRFLARHPELPRNTASVD